jgi:hypothetical protein
LRCDPLGVSSFAVRSGGGTVFAVPSVGGFVFCGAIRWGHVKVAFNQKIRKGWRVHNVAQEERPEERVGGNVRTH